MNRTTRKLAAQAEREGSSWFNSKHRPSDIDERSVVHYNAHILWVEGRKFRGVPLKFAACVRTPGARYMYLTPQLFSSERDASNYIQTRIKQDNLPE